MKPLNWSTACPDWQDRIVARQSLIPCKPLFPSQGKDALNVFKSLQVADQTRGENGKFPTLGDLCDTWVFEFVEVIFGAFDPASATRLIREFLLLISKKNGKSTIASGIMITALVINFREHAELLILAPTLEIAKNTFDAAEGMVSHDAEMSDLLHVSVVSRKITHRLTGAALRVVSADSMTVAGTKASFVLVDELWLFGKRPKSDSMLREATGGLFARPEGFTIYLTTHSDEPPAGVFKDKLDYFRMVRDGEIDDPATLGVLYEWPKAMLDNDDFLKPENWYVTNPSIGRAIREEFIRAEILKVQRGESKDSIQIVYAKHLNVEIGLRLGRDRWIGADYWEQAADPTLTLETLLDRCEVAVVGIDGGGADDLYGLCVAGRETGTGRWLFWVHAWARNSVLDRNKSVGSVLRDLEASGDLTICDEMEFDEAGVMAAIEAGNAVEVAEPPDISGVIAVIEQVRGTGLLPEKDGIAVDPAGISLTVDALNRIGIENDAIFPVTQGWRLNPAVTMLPRMLHSGMARHAGQPMMNWCVGNAKETLNGNARSISKAVSGAAKIDPVIAMLNAFMLLARAPQAGAGMAFSPWDDPDFSLTKAA